MRDSNLMRMGWFDFILPATPESFVEGYNGQKLIALSTGQIQLRREKLLLSLQNLVVISFAGSVTLN